MIAGIATSPFVTPQQQTRQAAEQLVATTFIKPLLEQMRQDPFRSELFHGRFTEDTFGAQLDTILADRITHRMNLPIVDAVYRQITARAGASAGGRLDMRG